eukprot:2768569-Amphidinium_carterae.1
MQTRTCNGRRAVTIKYMHEYPEVRRGVLKSCSALSLRVRSPFNLQGKSWNCETFEAHNSFKSWKFEVSDTLLMVRSNQEITIIT